MYQESHEQGIGYSLMIRSFNKNIYVMSLKSMGNGYDARNPAAGLHP